MLPSTSALKESMKYFHGAPAPSPRNLGTDDTDGLRAKYLDPKDQSSIDKGIIFEIYLKMNLSLSTERVNVVKSSKSFPEVRRDDKIVLTVVFLSHFIQTLSC